MKRLDRVLRIASKLAPRERILDIGGGDGKYATKLYHVLESKEVEWLDKIQGFYIDKKSFPYKFDCFDFIFAGNMVEIVPDADFLLSEIHRILNWDGVAILTFPSLDWWANKIAILLGYQPYGDRPSTEYNVGKLFIRPQAFSEKNSGYFHYFSRRAFKQLAEFYGFSVKFHTLPWQRFSIVTLRRKHAICINSTW